MNPKIICLVLVSGFIAVNCNIIEESILSKLPQKLVSDIDLIELLPNKDFSFPSVFHARKFVSVCNKLKEELDKVDAQAWDGAASEVRKLIEEPRIVEICNVPEATLDSLEILDDLGPSENISPTTVNLVQSFRGMMEEDKVLGVMFSKLVDQKLSRMSLKIMNAAIEDTPTLFGEKRLGWFGTVYLTGCELKKVSKICAIARGSSRAEINGHDFAALRDTIKSLGEIPDLQQLKESCKLVSPNLLLFRYIDQYQKAGELNEWEIEKMCRASSEFNFYYQLKRLCDLVLQ